VSSRIINGVSRTVDVSDVTRLWEDDDSDAGRSRRRMRQTSNRDKEGEISDGKSDASYHERQSLAANSTPADGGFNAGLELLSSRERLLQSTDGSAAAPRQSSAMMIAIQQAPE
jgi:hypothetical protein